MEIKRDHTIITINTRMFDNSGNLYPAFNLFTTSVSLVIFNLVLSELLF